MPKERRLRLWAELRKGIRVLGEEDFLELLVQPIPSTVSATRHTAETQMNLQIHHVISDITGLTGMRIIRAIVAGERDRHRLAAMRNVRTKANEETIAKSLEGDYRPEHLFALKQSLELFDSYQKQIQACGEQIGLHLSSLESKANPEDELKAARRPKKRHGSDRITSSVWVLM
jgi:hypothetical protein